MADRQADKRSSVLIVAAILIVFVIYVRVWSQEKNQVKMHKALQAAQSYARKGQMDDAIIAYSNAITYGADPKVYCYQRAVFEQLSGHLFLAEGDYRRCIQLDPKNINALVNLAEIEFRVDDFDNAFRHADEALRYDPKNATALTVRAMCYTQRHQYQNAIADTTGALSNLAATDSARQGILVRRAAAYRYLGKTTEAQQDIETARKIFESHITRKSPDVFAASFAHKWVRPDFTFYSYGAETVSQPYIDFASRFLAYINENLLPLKKDSSLRIFLFPSAQAYRQTMLANGERPNSIGYYSPTYNAIFTYDQLEKGSLARSLMSKAMAEMPFTDAWATTGIPDLLARFYGYPDGDSYHLYIGVPKPWLDEVLRKRLLRVDLLETLAQQFPGLTDSESRLAALYLYRRGKLHQYLELCRNGQVDQHVTLFETVFGKSAKQMAPEWMKYILELQQQNLAVARLPAAMIWDRPDLFNQFMHAVPAGLLPPDPPGMKAASSLPKPMPAPKPKQ
jgi:tetratricopeptide (TPR) repeat protein